MFLLVGRRSQESQNSVYTVTFPGGTQATYGGANEEVGDTSAATMIEEAVAGQWLGGVMRGSMLYQMAAFDLSDSNIAKLRAYGERRG